MTDIKLQSPHPFSERLLLFGGGGAGKSNTALTVAKYMHEAHMYVVDADYSGSYDRALATDFVDVQDVVTVHNADPEWDSFIKTFADTVAEANPEADWIVIDPVGSSYDWVQEWVLEQVHGGDLSRMLVELKRDNLDSRDYARARSELMNWELVKKEYSKLWKAIQRWKGNLILIAEAKAVPKQIDDKEAQMLFGPLGFMPVGHANLKHVASTTLFLDHPKRGQWRMTSIKDRNRDELDREDLEDFGMDYLLAVAGWEMAR